MVTSSIGLAGTLQQAHTLLWVVVCVPAACVKYCCSKHMPLRSTSSVGCADVEVLYYT
jgi:hypothetical protein